MSKIHLCGRWQLVNKRTFDSSGCFGRAHTPSHPLPSFVVPFGQFFFPSLGSNAAKCKGHLAASLARIALAIVVVVVVAVHRHICELPVRHAPHTHTQTHPVKHTCSTHTVDVGENNVQPLSANVPNNDLQASAIYMISNKNKLQAIHFT